MRDVNQLIALLEEEAGDHAIASGGQDLQDRLRARLSARRRVAPTSSTSSTTIST